MGLGLEVRGGFFRSGHPAAEVLFEKDGVKVSRETLRRWMVEDGLWLSRKQRRSFHQPRLRREAYGELIQIDGSEHRWFEDHYPRPDDCVSGWALNEADRKLAASTSPSDPNQHRAPSGSPNCE